MQQATARAHSNIAFIKYWGNTDDELRIPVNDSISMNLDSLYTETTVTWDDTLQQDELVLGGETQTGKTLDRVSQHLDLIRERLGVMNKAQVVSQNNFPMGTGIASSAAAFAALTVAAVTAAGATLEERELTTLARCGSGSASRSISDGFVIWHQGTSHETSYAESFAPPSHWLLADVIAIVSDQHKNVGSRQGHTTASTSDLQIARVGGAEERVRVCKQAILDKDFAAFAEVVEHDSNLMHAVMMTSRPPLFYWKPATLTIMEAVREWRAEGLNVCYTLDAGPNVHCICTPEDAAEVRNRLETLSGLLEIRTASCGEGARILSSES